MTLKFWNWFKKQPKGVDFKFLQWFELKKQADPKTNPTDLAVLEEYLRYQKAVMIARQPLEKISRFEMGDGVVFKDNVTAPDLGTDKPEDFVRKLKSGVHQSVQTGPDTFKLSGVGAIGESVTIVGQVNKKQLYSLGYDIKEENQAMVKALGVESPASIEGVSEQDLLKNDGVGFTHYSGKPEDRPWEMRPTEPLPEEFLGGIDGK